MNQNALFKADATTPDQSPCRAQAVSENDQCVYCRFCAAADQVFSRCCVLYRTSSTNKNLDATVERTTFISVVAGDGLSLAHRVIAQSPCKRT